MTDSFPLPCDLLITGCDVVPFDAGRSVILDGAVAIAGNRIVWMGTAEAAKREVVASEMFHAPGQIAMPGLIDGHMHTAQQLLRGKLGEIMRRRPLKIPIWKNYLIPFESILTPEDVYLSGMLAYTNMISVGTTCFAEAGGPHPDEMGRAALETGVRGLISQSTVDKGAAIGTSVPENMMMESKTALKANTALVERWAGQDQDRVRGCMSLRQILVCTPGLLTDIAAAADDLDTKIHTHLCEGTYEVDYALEHHGCRPVEYLESLGVLSRHLHCAHSVLLAPNEVDLYDSHRVSACHCSFNNYGMGAPRALEMWRRGIDLCLGTDGAGTWGTIDMFQVAHTTRFCQQTVAGTPWHIRHAMLAEEALEMAITGGARALGLQDDIGSLEVGKKADILLVGKDLIDQYPGYDPLGTVTSTVIGRDVKSVIIDGKVVMKDREIQTVDMDRLRFDLDRKVPEIMTRFDALVG